MSNPTTPSRKPRRFHWGYLLAAVALAALLFFGSLIVFPDWTRINGWVFVLLAVAFSVAVEFIANLRTAIAPDSTPDAAPLLTTQQTNVTQSDISASGDVVVGGSKIEAGGDVAMRDVIKTVYEAPAPIATSLHQLPPPPRDFTGREAELTELMTALEKGGVTISGVQGMGGVGKTALALKLAERLAPRYPDAQFYLDLKGAHEQKPLTVAEALSHVIRAYHPTAKLPESEAELHGLYQSVLHNQRALLLMDNAANAAQVEPLIPPASCVLLVTSRQHFTLPGLDPKNLDTLPPNDARDLLLKIAPRLAPTPSLPRSQTARSGEGAGFADAIAKLCGYLPLALRLAGSALAKRVALKPEDYVRRLTDAQARLELIDASLSLSYELLSDELQVSWCKLAVFPDTFDGAAAAAVWELEPDPAQDVLDTLIEYSLLEWNETTARYRLHDLARLFANARLEDAERAAAQRRHAKHFQIVLSAANYFYLEGGENVIHGLALFDLEWTNIQAGQAWTATHIGSDDATLRLCSDYPQAGGYLLLLRLHPSTRIYWSDAALAAARRLKDRKAEGLHLEKLGIAYGDLGEFRRSVELFTPSVAIAREIGDRQSEGAVLGNLGVAYKNLGEPRRAIQFYEQHLAIAREIGDRHGGGNALGNLGLAYADLGETRRAIEFFEQALTIAREIGDRRGEGNALGNLGNAYYYLGETHRAIEFYEQSLTIARDIGDRHNEGIWLGNLGLAYADLGETRRAIQFYEQASVIDREIGDRLSEGAALGNLGNAYADLGETRRAIEFFEQALTIAREIGDRRGEGNALNNLGQAYAALGETRRAIEFYEKCLVIHREIGDRRGEGQALDNLGLAYADLGETRRAIEFFEQALTIAREIGDRRGEGNALGNLGIAYKNLGETRRAIEFFEQALVIAREIGNRRGEGQALGNLGTAYNTLGETRRAIELYEQCLVIHREIGDRRGEGTDLWNMSLTLDKLGKREQAIALAEAALKIYEQIEDPYAAKVRKQLAAWRRENSG